MNWRFANRSQPVVKPVVKPTASSPVTTINLSGGFACPDLLPDIAAAAIIAAQHYRQEGMQYSSSFGLDDLRQAIASLMEQEGVRCGRNNILIVNGAKQGLDLICRIFLNPGDGVIVTAPTYMTALSIFRNFEVEFIAIPPDSQGIDIKNLEASLSQRQRSGKPAPKLLFDVPDFHNPSTITTSLVRRQQLLALARRYDFVIVEDNPYGKIRFEGEELPPIKALDDEGRVIFLGTASKILAPGLRLGWVVADEQMIARMAAQKAEGGTSAYLQRIFTLLLQDGTVARHIEQSKARLILHRDAMMTALAHHLPDLRFTKPEGGYYLWLELPPEMDADKLVAAALARGVAVYSSRISDPFQRENSQLRLCYSYEEPARIEEGIKRLATAFATSLFATSHAIGERL